MPGVKKILSIAALAAVAFAFLFRPSVLRAQSATGGYPDLSPAEAREVLGKRSGDPDFVLLDVRTPKEFREERIEGAVMVDYLSPVFRDEVAKLDREKTYLVYCRTGNRTKGALQVMRELGFRNVLHLRAGSRSGKMRGSPPFGRTRPGSGSALMKRDTKEAPRTAAWISAALLRWFRTAARPMAWRDTRDPYRIWVSEIMLQQTRVETVAPYYERFLRKYPRCGIPCPGAVGRRPQGVGGTRVLFPREKPPPGRGDPRCAPRRQGSSHGGGARGAPRDRPIDGRSDRRDRLRGGCPDPRCERAPRRRPSLRRRRGSPVRRGGESPLETVRQPGAKGEGAGHGPRGDGPGRRRLPAERPSLPGVSLAIPLFLLPPGTPGFDPSEAREENDPSSRCRGGGVPPERRSAVPDASPNRRASGRIVGLPIREARPGRDP